MIGQIVGAVSGIAGGLIGGGKRRREQREAQAEYAANKARFEGLDTSNVYADMENTMEDLTVNQEQARFQAEQANQGLANVMGGMQGAAGGSGIAAMAQALAGQQQQQARQASLDIGRQEQANQMAERKQASQLQLYEAKGELISRDAEQDKVSTMLGMSQQRLAAANQARQAATSGLIGGIGSAAGVGAAVFGKGKLKAAMDKFAPKTT